MDRLTKWLDNRKALCIEVCEKECTEWYYECHDCKPFTDVMKKLAEYEDIEEQVIKATGADIASMVGEYMHYYNLQKEHILLELPCKVGDVVYLIDEDENRHLKVYEGVWTRVSVVQRSVDGNFELCGHISYDIYDCFYNDGRTMKHGMYVGQDRTKVGETVFLTKAEAEKALSEMEK